MNSPTGNSARLAALSLLEAVVDRGLNLAEADGGNNLAQARDRAFARHLAYGVLRWLTALEWLAGQLLRRPLKRRDQDIHRLILIGLLQLWKDAAAPHAAINETAESARKLGKTWAVGVINAVLRRFQREQDEWLAKLAKREECFAHPAWLTAMLKADWPDDWREIIAANNQPAPLWLRLNRNFPAARTIEALEQDGFTLESHSAAPAALRISPAAPVNELAGFKQGLFSVQDPAAQLAAGLLDVRGGHRVLDACAAPGGKTCHLLEYEPGLMLTALDRSPQRLELIRDNLVRLGFEESEQIRLLVADAANPESWSDGVPFDRILLDAPCTATGVIRRHPEIKWLRSPGQLDDAVSLQSSLLDRLWPLLTAGGMLLYATCSVLKDENSGQIRQFLERTADAELSEPDASWGREQDAGRQILPGELEMDGFYYARMRKIP